MPYGLDILNQAKQQAMKPKQSPSNIPSMPNWGWIDFEGDYTQDILKNTQRRAGIFAESLMDFSSPFYQQYRSYMGSMTPTLGTNAWLAPLIAGGGNYAGSQAQANILQQNYQKQRNDFLNTGTKGFAAGNIGTAGSLLGIQGQIGNSILQGQLAREQMDAQSGGMLDFLGTGFGTLFPFLPGMFSGGGASAAMALPAVAMSDVRFKENITYTGKETKDGIPIVEFNYINSDQRYRGVIAQDAEEKRPDAVTEINGYKYVYYGAL